MNLLSKPKFISFALISFALSACETLHQSPAQRSSPEIDRLANEIVQGINQSGSTERFVFGNNFGRTLANGEKGFTEACSKITSTTSQWNQSKETFEVEESNVETHTFTAIPAGIRAGHGYVTRDLSKITVPITSIIGVRTCDSTSGHTRVEKQSNGIVLVRHGNGGAKVYDKLQHSLVIDFNKQLKAFRKSHSSTGGTDSSSTLVSSFTIATFDSEEETKKLAESIQLLISKLKSETQTPKA